MKVLVVSFDKSLVKGIKEALKEYEVIDVKNGEEAVNTVRSADVIIYDAISGSISEEDINKMYQSKFKTAKYIVLVDDLFPVDMNNITVQKKVKLPREEAISKIKQALSEEPVQEIETPFQAQKMELEIAMPSFEQQEEEAISYTSEAKKKRVLIVSFDSTLTDSIKTALGTDFEITNVKNAKDATEKAREVDIVVFDTISGMIAQKTLMEMSQKEELAQKHYILLIDDLFTIDVDKINLPNKHSFSREAEIAKAIEKIKEFLKEETPTYEVSDEIIGLLDELFKEQNLERPPKELELESFPLELPPESKREIIPERPLEEPRQEIVPESPFQELKQELIPESPPKEKTPEIKVPEVDMEKLLKEHIKEVLSQKFIEDVLTNAVREMSIDSLIEGIIRDQVGKQLSGINLADIIREEASKVLRERLREIIT